LIHSQFAVLLLASAVAIPAFAQPGKVGQATQSSAAPDVSSSQQWQTATPQSTPPSAAQQQTPSGTATTATQNTPPKEGFWGRVNPFARKKWVKKQTDAINDRLSELDEVNAKNANDIKDVDGRAQAGIRRAQSAADAANQAATAAGQQALMAGDTAKGADMHVNRLNSTVNGLDQYRQVTEADIAFRSGSPILSAAAKKQLDDLAATVAGHQGYILEVEAHSPAAGSVGIQNSERLAESVKRYLVTEHQIPVYRMHAVALGNAQVAAAGDEDARPARIRTSSVHIRLMANSLAAQEAAPLEGVASSNGAERP
jgi:outer membrane protein OmpA-like peptidoglycan-associated protein